MKTLKKSFALLLLISFLFPAVLISQNFEDFQKSVLIDIPGDNYDFDLVSGGIYYPFSYYITWLNKTDSVYTIYLKKISPETIDSNIVISSDNIVKSNPQVAFLSPGPGISIFWENFTGSFYQIIRRDYHWGSLSDQVIFKDSLSDDPQITMNYNHLAWIMDDCLYLKQLFPDTSITVLIDTDISSPSLDVEDTPTGMLPLIYEKSVNGNLVIYLAEYYIYPDPHWEYYELSDGRNPDFGTGSGISFERIEDGISRITYNSNYYTSNFFTTENTSCNYKNPDVFSYPIHTDQPTEDTPFFVVFDTDSIENNNEVMLKTMYTWPVDSVVNISDMEGDDSNPKADVVLFDDIPYVVIIWIHQDGVHSTIWMAKTLYQPAGGVKDDGVDLSSFDLLQNYPNPFNPVTNIEYSLTQGADVKVTVFDILGNRIATLVDRYEYTGSHKVVFDGKNLSSGVYFYTIEVNSLQKTKAMILLR